MQKEGITSGIDRIILLVTQLERGGAQRVARRLADHFHALGGEVQLVFFYDKADLLDAWREASPYPVLSLGAKAPGEPAWKTAFKTSRALWRLFRLLRHSRPSVIFTFTHYANWLGIPIAWLARVPVRIAMQRARLVGFPRLLSRWDAFLVNRRFATVMVAVSESVRRFCLQEEGMRAERVRVIPNGVSASAYRALLASRDALRAEMGLDERQRIVLSVGRLHPQKGFADLLLGAQRTLQQADQALFWIVGEGKQRLELEHLIQALGLSDGVQLLGWREDVARLMVASDLFVLPSHWEGMPNALLQAMAAERAVLVTDVDGMSDLVEHGVTGMKVPPGDVGALSSVMRALLEDDDKRALMGKAAGDLVRRGYSEERMLERFTGLVSELSAGYDLR